MGEYHYYPVNVVDCGGRFLIGIERTVGADPMTGTPRAGTTQIALRVQVN